MERWWGGSTWTSHYTLHRRLISASARALRSSSPVMFSSQVSSLREAVQEAIQLLLKGEPFLGPQSILAMHELVGVMETIHQALRTVSENWQYVALLCHDCSRRFKLLHFQLRDSVLNVARSAFAPGDEFWKIVDDFDMKAGRLQGKLRLFAYGDRRLLLEEVDREDGGQLLAALSSRILLHLYTINSQEIQLGKLIGRGAFGEVYKALWLGYPFAVKVFSSVDYGYESFRREVETLLKLRHPNVVRVVGYSHEPSEDKYLIVMEKLENDLAAFINRNMEHSFRGLPFKGRVALNIMQQVAEAMRYLHACNIIHRDLKPENILVSFWERDGKIKYSCLKAKVSDFGLARANFITAMVTNATVGAGTLCYMAPEVYWSDSYSKKADVYSFGIVCYQILTGRVPFRNMMNLEPREFMQRIQNGTRPVLSARECPRYLKRLIMKSWSSDAEERPEFSVICDTLRSFKNHLLSCRATQLRPV